MPYCSSEVRSQQQDDHNASLKSPPKLTQLRLWELVQLSFAKLSINQQLPAVIEAYTDDLKVVFALCAAGFSLAKLMSLTGSWKRSEPDVLKKAAGGAA